MNKLVIMNVYPLANKVIVGLFPEDGGESRMTITLSKKLFPEDIKVGDEVVFQKKAKVLQIAGN